MCKNAQSTAVNLLTAIEPTIKNLLAASGIADSDQGKQIITYYDAAVAAVKNWESGSPAQEAVEAIYDVRSALPLLPIPADLSAPMDVILAGIAAVIGVLNANSPTTSSEPIVGANTEASTEEEVHALHQAAVIHDTTTKVQSLVPGFKRSIFTSPAHQYKNAWNNSVDENKLPDTLKV